MTDSREKTSPIISLKGVCKDFAIGQKKARAVRAVDLDIERREIFGIIGSSGAGKSTLLRLINLLERPTAGRVIFDDADITESEGLQLRLARRKIGMVFQHFNLLHSKTVAQNIAFPLELAGERDRAVIANRVDDLLRRVGLEEHAAKYPKQLSGGQKQRVGVARALALQPEVLLCDEATSALDPQTTHSVLRLLAQINRDFGLTIVLITHEMNVVRQVCHRVAVLDAGKVVEMGPVESVFLHPRHPKTRELVRESDPGEIDATAVVAPIEGRLYRLTFTGDQTYHPVLGSIAREFGIDYVIRRGRVSSIRDIPYAQLDIAFVGGKTDAALTRLRSLGIDIEQLSGSDLQEPHLAATS